jgi:hypothetical protein
MVAHASKPSTWGGGSRRIMSSRPPWATKGGISKPNKTEFLFLFLNSFPELPENEILGPSATFMN